MSQVAADMQNQMDIDSAPLKVDSRTMFKDKVQVRTVTRRPGSRASRLDIDGNEREESTDPNHQSLKDLKKQTTTQNAPIKIKILGNNIVRAAGKKSQLSESQTRILASNQKYTPGVGPIKAGKIVIKKSDVKLKD